jgi:ABC-type transporter Mla subunit MlaD
MGLSRILEQYQDKASETSEGIDHTLKNFINSLAAQLNAVEFPQDIFSSRLKAPIAQLNDVTTDATVSVKHISENVKNAANSVSSSVDKINTKAESLSEVLSVAQTLTAEQQELLFAIKRQQQSVIDQLQAYHEEMLKTMSTQQGGMLGELREHSELMSGVNVVMNKLANSIGENREVADDFRKAWLNITQVAGEMGNVVKGSMEKITPAIVSLEDMAKQSSSETKAATASFESLENLMAKLITLNEVNSDQRAATSRQLQAISDLNTQIQVLNENLMHIVPSSPKPVTENPEVVEGPADAAQAIAHTTETSPPMTIAQKLKLRFGHGE